MTDKTPKEEINEFYEYMKKFAGKYPKIGSNLNALGGSTMQDGKLGNKEKELVALGIAVGLRCVPCIYSHTKAALNRGATEEEIMEAACVAISMGGGPGMVYVINVMKALESFLEN